MLKHLVTRVVALHRREPRSRSSQRLASRPCVFPFYLPAVEVLQGCRLLIRSFLLPFLVVPVFTLEGSAGFITAPSYAVGPAPLSVAMGDFNGDGIPDLAVANLGTPTSHTDGSVSYADGSVSVLLGKGDGTFQAAQTYPIGSGAFSVAVGDFNGDRILDLAVCNLSGVSILLGKGEGTFQAAQGVSSIPGSVAVADFNGDGIPDLAVVDNNYPNPGTVTILLGRGEGTFEATHTYPIGINPGLPAVGDFNGDGTPDLVVPNSDSNTLSVLLGNGDGTFQAARNYATGSGPGSVAVGDFNGDGHLDLAVAKVGNFAPGTVSILLGNGDGTFQAARSYDAGYSPQRVAVGDFNADGFLDLVVVTGGGGTVSVLLGKGDGSFQPLQSYDAGSYPRSVAVADFNGDGHLDLAVVSAPDTGFGNGIVSLLFGNGDSTFQTTHSYDAGYDPRSVAVGDFNGDGILDFAVANNEVPVAVRILLGRGDGTFQPAQTYPIGSGAFSVAVGDFNGDGHLDIAVASRGYALVCDLPNVSVLLGNGDGTFQAPRTYATGFEPSSVAVGDFNGDGRLDLAVAGRDDNSVSILLGQGDGTFQAAQSYAVGAFPISVAVGDFNGDGHLDLAVANAGTYPNFPDGSVSILLGKGDGTFQAAQSYAAGSSPSAVVLGDVNGDGHLDLVGADAGTDPNYSAGSVSVLLGYENGTFHAAQSYPVGINPRHVAVGDFNGDGFPDIAVATERGVTVLLNAADWGGG